MTRRQSGSVWSTSISPSLSVIVSIEVDGQYTPRLANMPYAPAIASGDTSFEPRANEGTCVSSAGASVWFPSLSVIGLPALARCTPASCAMVAGSHRPVRWDNWMKYVLTDRSVASFIVKVPDPVELLGV